MDHRRLFGPLGQRAENGKPVGADATKAKSWGQRLEMGAILEGGLWTSVCD